MQSDYGFSVAAHTFDWTVLKRQRDQHVLDLNGHYERNLLKHGVEIIRGNARFVGPKTVKVGADTFTAEHIVIAVGGRPVVPELPGAGFGITSDGFFELVAQPKKVAVVGGGYIAVELAGMLRALGSEVTMILRRAHFLNDFDTLLRDELMTQMQADGVRVIAQTKIAKVEKARHRTAHHAGKRRTGRRIGRTDLGDRPTAEYGSPGPACNRGQCRRRRHHSDGRVPGDQRGRHLRHRRRHRTNST